MPGFNVDDFMKPVSADNPCGENLEYDPAYMELFTLAEGKPEQEIGGTLVAAEEPNWRDVRTRAVDLWARTRDLRLASLLTLAELRLEGIEGAVRGLHLMRRLLEEQWEGFYPRLDPDDNNDPTMRVNILDAFVKPPNTFGDPWKFQTRLIEAPLVESAQIGRFSFRDILLATGEMTLPEGSAPPPGISAIEAAFDAVPLETLTAMVDTLALGLGHAKGIDKAFTEKVGASRAMDLSALTKLFFNMHKAAAARLERRAGPVQGAEDASGGGHAGGGKGEPGARIAGEVRSREDVMLALDKIVRYYESFEPSSPVPILVKRARRLVGKSYVEAVKDLTPDAVSALSILAGIDLAQTS
ncbi:MAG: type VI secretion system protein TssA [Phycisphaerales bacterium]|nr:type VI secretion system protein TssA [Phycisphaerales bacterium]